MSDRIKKAAMGVALLAAFALGGAAVAGAVSGSSGSSAGKSGTSTAPQSPPRMHNGRRAGESPLSGSTAEQVRAAALAKVPGGTIDRIETDADGHAAYEAHMTRSDGSPCTVYVNKQFEVVGVEDGPLRR